MASKRYYVQYLNGTIWTTHGSYGSEQSALIQGSNAAKRNPNKKYRMVVKENGREMLVHIW